MYMYGLVGDHGVTDELSLCKIVLVPFRLSAPGVINYYYYYYYAGRSNRPSTYEVDMTLSIGD